MEYRFPRDNEWIMTHEKREWVPEWLYSLYAKLLPAWLQPFRWFLNKAVGE